MLGTAISSHCWPCRKRKPRIPHLGPTRRRAFVDHAVAGRGGPLTEAIIAYAGDYGRYGYRRITALLRADGWLVNVKRVHRIWRGRG